MKTLLALVVLSLSLAAHADYWTLQDGVKRYVDYVPGHSDKPVVVMVNGLVYELDRWSDLREDLQKRGYGVLNYYMRGQHLTLLKEHQEKGEIGFFKAGLSVGDLADELHEILALAQIKRPVVVLGLSYGAGAAAEFARRYPQQIDSLIFLAPLVVSLENYNPQGQWVNANLDWIRLMWGPVWGPQFYEMAYAAIYKTYLSQRIIPDRVPSELQSIPQVYRESIFHLTRAVRSFDLRRYDFSALSGHRVSFLLAKEEEQQAFVDQIKAFESLNPESQGPLVWLKDAEHAIPDSQPREAAALIDALVQRSRALENGKKYQYDGQGLRKW